jgi:hypothetical protein
MPIDPIMLPEVINNFLLSVTDQVSPIDVSALDQIRQNLDSVPDQFIVSELSVFKALKHLKPSKSVCDEFLSNRVLEDLADVLAGPICSLINSSIRQGVVPRQWKVAIGYHLFLKSILPFPSRQTYALYRLLHLSQKSRNYFYVILNRWLTIISTVVPLIGQPH